MSKTLEQIRVQAGKTQTQAAAVLGISPSAYGRKENGHRRLTAEDAVKLADLFGVPVQEVVLSARSCANPAQDEHVQPSQQ